MGRQTRHVYFISEVIHTKGRWMVFVFALQHNLFLQKRCFVLISICNVAEKIRQMHQQFVDESHLTFSKVRPLKILPGNKTLLNILLSSLFKKKKKNLLLFDPYIIQ